MHVRHARSLAELAGQRLEQPGQLTAHLVVQRAQSTQLLLGGLLTGPDGFLHLQPFLLGARLGVLADLLGLVPDLGEHSLGFLASGGGLLGDLPFALVQLDLALSGLLLERGGPRDERLFDLVAMRLGILAGALEQCGGLTSGGRANFGSLLLGGAEQLLHAVAEARLSALLLSFGGLLELRLGVAQFLLDPIGAPALALMRLLRLGQLTEQGPHVLVNLPAVVSTPDQVEHICLGRVRR
jgi:hypothetical protein